MSQKELLKKISPYHFKSHGHMTMKVHGCQVTGDGSTYPAVQNFPCPLREI